ncbi:MAG: ComF family protein [Bacteroidota bacterium]|jgi:competence protein ComFC
MSLVSDLLSLFYPERCAACDKSLYLHEKNICNKCYTELPVTNHYNQRENVVEQIFWGRAKIESAAALWFFHKESRVQKLLHNLKYKGRKGAGVTAGEWLGKKLKEESAFMDCDFIIPVPLHKKKLRVRGYNQSLCFAEGLSISMGIPIHENGLKRVEYSSTQTKESKFSRWENVSNLFECCDKEILQNKHILLVDDVITTGATLEACCIALSKVEKIKISIAAIAYAE